MPVPDETAIVLQEAGVLKIWDGDLTEEEMETTPPIEERHVLDGEVVKHIVGDEVVYDKQEGIGEKPNFAEVEVPEETDPEKGN